MTQLVPTIQVTAAHDPSVFGSGRSGTHFPSIQLVPGAQRIRAHESGLFGRHFPFLHWVPARHVTAAHEAS